MNGIVERMIMKYISYGITELETIRDYCMANKRTDTDEMMVASIEITEIARKAIEKIFNYELGNDSADEISDSDYIATRLEADNLIYNYAHSYGIELRTGMNDYGIFEFV